MAGGRCGCAAFGTGQYGIGDTGLQKCECMLGGTGLFSDCSECCRGIRLMAALIIGVKGLTRKKLRKVGTGL